MSRTAARPLALTRPAPPPLLRHVVGRILRDRRTDADRTLRDVAHEARVSVAYLSEIERGRKEASSEVLVAVCGALGLSLADLLARAHDQLVGPGARVLSLTSRAAGPATAGAPSAPSAGTVQVGARVMALAA
ncbi:helix-turn-helix transcriptional regulator [Cellulomonas sp. APG4]|uniref:helix-turn-helix domain-containing protein n=1 Tax=Cellulomonas sp. APG4 TaxID=1538656 RepID=UPI001379A7DC|nr:helix-turn-helix transcriptional regulator [Cellulomonas sp. APG4]NCT89474.1 helix-turn-helix transcriptional regulator [Cellulomonas sp. APG4]